MQGRGCGEADLGQPEVVEVHFDGLLLQRPLAPRLDGERIVALQRLLLSCSPGYRALRQERLHWQGRRRDKRDRKRLEGEIM
jgi:hypothetical protein